MFGDVDVLGEPGGGYPGPTPIIAVGRQRNISAQDADQDPTEDQTGSLQQESVDEGRDVASARPEVVQFSEGEGVDDAVEGQGRAVENKVDDESAEHHRGVITQIPPQSDVEGATREERVERVAQKVPQTRVMVQKA